MTYERTISDSRGTRTETVTTYLATAAGCSRMPQSGRPVRFTATSEADAIRQALDFFGCMRSALSIWPEGN